MLSLVVMVLVVCLVQRFYDKEDFLHDPRSHLASVKDMIWGGFGSLSIFQRHGLFLRERTDIVVAGATS